LLTCKSFAKALTIVDKERVIALGQAILEFGVCAVVDASIQLPEGWQSSGPHPHNEIFILVTIVAGIILIQLIHVLVPCRGVGRAFKS
jgi:hypothetical protein